ncbi:MAG: DNA-3-methyladenine glycosylase 2 family protein [Azospirillaceae bacterium]
MSGVMGGVMAASDPAAGAPDEGALAAAVEADAAALAEAEPRFAPALPDLVHFPVRLRPPGFAALVRIILDQQVSTRAAEAMWGKLSDRLDPVEPPGFLALDDATLKACGFSRQKMRYARHLAEALEAGELDLAALAAADDATVTERLVALPGLGPWSAECFLMFSLGRRDVLPAGDLAVRVAWQRLAGLDAPPATRELAAIGQDWAPRRTAAAYLLYGRYLGDQARARAG